MSNRFETEMFFWTLAETVFLFIFVSMFVVGYRFGWLLECIFGSFLRARLGKYLARALYLHHVWPVESSRDTRLPGFPVGQNSRLPGYF